MPVAAFTLPVDAPSETVWRLLADSADLPQRYDATVDAVRVLGETPDGILREVRRNGVTRREVVSVDPQRQSLTLTLVDDPAYTGSIVLRAEAGNASSSGHSQPRLSGRMDWQPRSGSEERAQGDALSAALQAQLLALKHAAEAHAAHAGA